MKYNLNDIAVITSSKRIFANEYKSSGIPFYRGKEITQLYNHKAFSDLLYISEDKYNELIKNFGVPQENDILITAVGTIGSLYLVGKNDKFYFKDGNLIWLKNIDKTKVIPKYLYYLLSTNETQSLIDSITIGSTQTALTIEGVKMLNFDFPELKVQQHIVDTIGSVDDLIEKNDKIIELTKRYIHQIYRSFDFNSTEKTLQDEFNISIGRIPPTKEHQWFDNGNYKWLSIKDMKIDGDFCFETSQYLTNEAVKKFNIPIVNPGDVLLSFKLTVGRIAISNCNMVTNEAIACFKFKDESLRWYLYCYLNNCNFFNDADNTSSIGQAINSSIIKKYKFLKPSNEKLTEFNNIVKPLFNYVKTKREENIYLLQSKQNLLKKYFG